MSDFKELYALDDHRDSLTTTDARCGQSITPATSVKLVQHSQNQARTRRAQRMSECYRARVHVSTAAIESEFFLDCEIHRGKRFIHFHEIDVIQRQSRFLQRHPCCRHWTDSHDLRFHSRIRPAHNPAHRLEIFLLHEIFARNHECSGAIDDP